MAEKKEGKEGNLTKVLLDNNVALQKKSMSLIEASTAITNNTAVLVKKIDGLAGRIEKLLGVFEEASKHVAEAETVEERVNELTTKLETLLDQNKSVARGLILLEKYVRGKSELEKQAPRTEEYSGL